jgi:hypothetical protein
MKQLQFSGQKLAVWAYSPTMTDKQRGASIPDVILLIYLIHLAALDPGVYSAPNRNEYRKHT